MAAYEPESGYADPNGSTTSLLTAARAHGARLVQDCKVTGITQAAGKVTGVETDQGMYAAPVVVNAAGAWAAEVGAFAGLEIPVDTWRHDTMFVRRPPALGPSHPTVIDDIHAMYFRPETGGLTLVGLEDHNPLGLSPDGEADRPLPGFVERGGGAYLPANPVDGAGLAPQRPRRI